MSCQDFAGAKEDLEVVVASDVKAVAPHYWLGIALENLGRRKRRSRNSRRPQRSIRVITEFYWN